MPQAEAAFHGSLRRLCGPALARSHSARNIEFAPYVVVEYEAKLGQTADLARAEGEDVAGLKILIGLRAWF